MQLTVRRDGRTLALSVFPRYSKTAGRMLVGVGFGSVPRPFGVLGAAGAALGVMWHATTETLTGFGAR